MEIEVESQFRDDGMRTLRAVAVSGVVFVFIVDRDKRILADIDLLAADARALCAAILEATRDAKGGARA